MKLKCTYIILLAFVLAFNSVNAQVYIASDALSYNGQTNITIEGKSFTTGINGASIYLSNCTNVIIKNCKFTLTKDIIGVQLNGCTNVEITGCYVENFRSGVYAVNCKGGINIHCNQFKDIAGAKPRGQMVQFNTCSGTGNKVNYNTLDHTFGVGTPEDLINMYASSGTAVDPIQIIGNQLRGGGPSTSGGGIMLGDNGGHDLRVEDNILVDVGQYGIGAPSGYNITIINNKLYGASQTWTNVGIYVGLATEIAAGFPCTGTSITVKNNQVTFYNKNNVLNSWYNCNCCSGIIQSGNNFNAKISTNILPAILTLNTTMCPITNNTIKQTINLKTGWNLISTNVSPVDSSIATLFLGLDVQEIKTETTFWRKGQNKALNSLQKITAGQGYFVKMNVQGTLSITGIPVKTQNLASLSNGWNLIGCPYQVSTTLSTLFNTTNTQMVKSFEGFWIPSGTTNSISNLEPNKGYFIKMK